MALIAEYKMDDDAANTTVTDTSGLGNNGTAHANTSTLSDAGRDAKGLRLSGAGADEIVVTSAANNEGFFSGGGTILCWINTDDASNVNTILDRSGVYGLSIDSSGTLDFYASFGSGTGDWNATNTTDDIKASYWYHIAMTYDSSNTSNDPVFYINGQSVPVTENGAPVGSSPNDTSQDIYLLSDFGSNSFDGVGQDLLIYNNALTATEIYEIYAAADHRTPKISLL